MVKYNGDLDDIFLALSDGTRRDILKRLAGRSHTVTELAEPYSISLPAVSKHIRILRRAGLVDTTRDGRMRRMGLAPGKLKKVSSWVERFRRFWEDRFDHLDRYLDGELH